MKVMRPDQVSLRPPASAPIGANASDLKTLEGLRPNLSGGHHFHVRILPSTGQKSGSGTQLIVISDGTSKCVENCTLGTD